MRDPVWVYDNWSAYVEGVAGHPSVPLTEDLALRQLDEVVRFKRLGVRFDYYMMNAFWYAPDGGYRKWREKDWPGGPDRWVARCHEHGIKPGLWFGSNVLWQLEPAAQWNDSLAATPSVYGLKALSFASGGFLDDFMSVLQGWYDRGIRMFEFDVADFDAATPDEKEKLPAAEIRANNERAFADALKQFRRRNPDIMLVAFNGFGGNYESTEAPFPFKDPVDLRWLEVFDTLYSGDTRASEVPQASFWRSVDLYNDHMARRYEQSGVPLERIDPFFTLSTTWFGYNRGKRAWKGMLILLMARGGWKKTVYGRLDLLTDEEVRWFERARALFDPLMALGRTKTFGAIPGDAEPYGFASFDRTGALYTVFNPSQEVRLLKLPRRSRAQPALSEGRVLFRDAGFTPSLQGDGVRLGPGQMALVGYGRFAAPQFDLGVQDDVVIPRKITPLPVDLVAEDASSVKVTVPLPQQGDIRMFFQQRDVRGVALKRYGVSGRVEAWQRGASVPVYVEAQAETSLGGLSWTAAEIKRQNLSSREPLTIRYSLSTGASKDAEPARFHAKLFGVEY